MKIFFRGLVVIASLFFLWQGLIVVFNLPNYILPAPLHVLKTFYFQSNLIISEAIPTMLETILGLVLGIFLGVLTAVSMAFFNPIRWWLFPIVMISQAIPTFAIAPLLVIWFGYGMTGKIITTVIMLFFPVTSAFYDGLRRVNSGWIDLAKTMNTKKSRLFWHICIPAALPQLATGIRVAAVIAPIGAVVGEWVGSSRGLGFLMLNANARMQIDLMFAALFAIIIFSLLLYFVIDTILRYVIYWSESEC